VVSIVSVELNVCLSKAHSFNRVLRQKLSVFAGAANACSYFHGKSLSQEGQTSEVPSSRLQDHTKEGLASSFVQDRNRELWKVPVRLPISSGFGGWNPHNRLAFPQWAGARPIRKKDEKLAVRVGFGESLSFTRLQIPQRGLCWRFRREGNDSEPVAEDCGSTQNVIKTGQRGSFL
jgi:hypothetical protein